MTGASGFLGRALCQRLLAAGRTVRAVTRQTVQLMEGVQRVAVDLRTGVLTAEHMRDVCTVYHLASAPDEATTEEHHEVSVRGTRMLLDAASNGSVASFVYVSSVKAMAETAEFTLDETNLPSPITPYGRAKRAAELVVLSAARATSMRVCVLRPAPIYGAGSRGFLARMLGAVSARRFPPLGEFNNRRAFVHVQDVAYAAELAAVNKGANGQIYIVTDTRCYSTREIYIMMCHALGRSVPVWHVPAVTLNCAARLGDAFEHVTGRTFPFNRDMFQRLSGSACYDCAKAQRELGYSPRFELAQGLNEMTQATIQ